MMSKLRLEHLSECLYRDKLVRMVCLLEPFEAICEKRIVFNLIDRNVPLKVVFTAAVIDAARHLTLPIGVPKVSLVLASARAEWICNLDLLESI